MASGRLFASCFLLFLMVMNTVGHYAFLVLLRNQIEIDTEKRIHSNLNEPGGNFIVKLPASALVDWKEQEPLKGYFSTKERYTKPSIKDFTRIHYTWRVFMIKARLL